MKFLGKFAPAAVVAAALVVVGGTATASSLITTAQIQNGAVTSAKIANGAVHPADIAPGLLTDIKSARTGVQGPQGPRGPQGPAGSDGQNGSDAFVMGDTERYPATTIENIGGPWSTGHTSVGTVFVKAGTYLVDVNADFYKVNDTDASPILQVALRADAPSVTGLTGYTAPFPVGGQSGLDGTNSPIGDPGTPKGLEQTVSMHDVIVVPKGGTTLWVDLFGYNADQGSEGSGDFGAITRLSLIQVVPSPAWHTGSLAR